MHLSFLMKLFFPLPVPHEQVLPLEINNLVMSLS